MIGSVGGVCISGFHQFVGRGNDRGVVTRRSADLVDSGSPDGNRDVPRVARYQLIDSVCGGDGDVFRDSRWVSSCARHWADNRAGRSFSDGNGSQYGCNPASGVGEVLDLLG